jgi:hypothetical protein
LVELVDGQDVDFGGTENGFLSLLAHGLGVGGCAT